MAIVGLREKDCATTAGSSVAIGTGLRHCLGVATVEVFVDDAVRGRLPHICVKTGVTADGRLRVEQERGGLGFAGLLVFLGPLGWIVLAMLIGGALVGGAGRREVLTVRLPYSEAAVDHEIAIRRLRLRSAAVGAGALLVAVALGATGHMTPGRLDLCALVTAVAALFSAAQHVRLVRLRVGVELDASRRWVTLAGVHPDFARAVEHQHASDAAGR